MVVFQIRLRDSGHIRSMVTDKFFYLGFSSYEMDWAFILVKDPQAFIPIDAVHCFVPYLGWSPLAPGGLDLATD